MQRPLIVFALFSLILTAPAFAQDAIAGAKAACENFSVLGATGDAAKLAEGFYSERDMFIGPAPVAGILIGREAIQKKATRKVLRRLRPFPVPAKTSRYSILQPSP